MGQATKAHFDATCQRLPDGRYENRWPWKTDPLNIPTNKYLALKRLEMCEKSLERSGKLAQYDDAVQDYLDMGHAEKAPAEPDGPVHFLPHQAVYKKNKVRVVFDAAAGHPNSLNDYILPGPNMVADLTGLLLRFRLRNVGVTADVEKAFLQLSLHPKDRDVTRFYWRERASDEQPEVYRMTRVVFGVTASPFLLQATIRKHLELYEGSDPDLVAILRRDIYCDDLITSVDTAEDADRLKSRSVQVFSDAHMNLRRWTVSGAETTDDRGQQRLLGDKTDEAQKVLGVCWLPESDKLMFKAEPLAVLGAQLEETKRNILKVAARFFDPLGLLTPFSVRAKMILKELWKAGIGWDQPIGHSASRKWEKWLQELGKLDGLAVPRSYGLLANLRYQMHVFCDASQHAYAAVVYVRTDGTSEEQKTALVMCRSRLSPSQQISLPRLELTSCLIGARLASYVKKQMDSPPVAEFYWTDSMVSMGWIRSDAQKWGVYVKNRVTEIQQLTSKSTWNHCPGSENPADLPSRGASASVLSSDLWQHGPSWLRADPLTWPRTQTDSVEPTECAEEARKMVMPARVISGPQVASGANMRLSQLIDAERYSSLDRLLRVTAWVLRWIHNARSKAKRDGPLSSGELDDAERLWVREVQQAAFPEEIAALEAGQNISKSSRLFALGPSLEDGVLRKTGRLQQSSLSCQEKHPIIMPPEHRFVHLLVQRAHVQLCHAGAQQVLSAVRDNYWVIRGRQRTRAILHACPKCAIFHARPYDQRPAPLPRDRVTPARPFSRSGVDIGGPLFIRGRGRGETIKVYFVVFTCAVVRAVHLELLSSLSTEDFLRAYGRFTARRGRVISMRSDNGLTFKGAAEILAAEGVSWIFNVERAPWWGGFWERVVGMTKSALRRTLGRSLLRWEELETVLCSIEAAINARPLTAVTDDPEDLRPLRPSDFLNCPLPSTEGPEDGERLQRRRRYQDTLLSHFWSRWQKEYLRNLRDIHRSQTTESPTQGDLVLIEGERSPNRLSWTTGLISALHAGRDGLVRSATVRTNRGDIRRPVQKLYLLEASRQ